MYVNISIILFKNSKLSISFILNGKVFNQRYVDNENTMSSPNSFIRSLKVKIIIKLATVLFVKHYANFMLFVVNVYSYLF